MSKITKILFLIYKQKMILKACWILDKKSEWWWETVIDVGGISDSGSDGIGDSGSSGIGDSGTDFFFLLNRKKFFMIPEHSSANTPLLTDMFLWNGCTGADNLSIGVASFPSFPSENSL